LLDVQVAAPGLACQYCQYLFAGGVRTHASSVGVGYAMPLVGSLMRQTNLAPSCWVPVVVNPTAFIAEKPVVEDVTSAKQPRSTLPFQRVKSTATSTPAEDVHELIGSAVARANPSVLLVAPAKTDVTSSTAARRIT
jgi:hypothetical protein